MRLSFYGAAGEVTGSCYLVQTSRARVLVDFGLHQGGLQAELRNWRMPPIEPGRLDAVVLTHAHLDHCGRLPLLTKAGYAGPIFCTPATIELTQIILQDSAHLQETDALQATKHRLRQGKPAVAPLYTRADVDAVMGLFRPVPYEQAHEVAPGVSVRLVDAGHILGSASVEMTAEDGAGGRRLVLAFSGDIGEAGTPLLNDPTPLTRADVVVMESTYGDRDHKGRDETVEELVGVLGEARRDRGKVLIPAFAVGRTQTLIYYFGQASRQGRLDGMPVYIDSPMAIATTELYRRHQEMLDAPARDLIEHGRTPLDFANLRFARTAQESEALNEMSGGVVVIAASGMCTGGRIMHHLKHSLWRAQTHLVIVGYQAVGTTGRQIVDGAKRVRVLGETIAVRAKVHTLGGLSAHAGQTGLMAWARNFQGLPASANRARMFLTHGEPRARDILADKINRELGIKPGRPMWGDAVEL